MFSLSLSLSLSHIVMHTQNKHIFKAVEAHQKKRQKTNSLETLYYDMLSASVHKNTNTEHDHASEQMDAPRYPDWVSEDVSEPGIQNPSSVPHGVKSVMCAYTEHALSALLVSGLVFPKVGFHGTCS